MADLPAGLLAGLADRYDVHDVVGRGGMATVYKGYDHRHRRPVALKVLPHIVALYDSGEVNGFLYYVMPFIEGESLRQVLIRLGLMDVDGALEITGRVADALDYAHRKGVLHRDVKPASHPPSARAGGGRGAARSGSRGTDRRDSRNVRNRGPRILYGTIPDLERAAPKKTGERARLGGVDEDGRRSPARLREGDLEARANPDPIPGLMLGLFFLLPGSFFLSHYIYKSVVATKRAALESLAGRVADHCEALSK